MVLCFNRWVESGFSQVQVLVHVFFKELPYLCLTFQLSSFEFPGQVCQNYLVFFEHLEDVGLSSSLSGRNLKLVFSFVFLRDSFGNWDRKVFRAICGLKCRHVEIGQL